jgi:uncharacterized RDD family membrane protein YckC
MTNNVYSTPESQLVNPVSSDVQTLASRWARLGASLIDSLIISVIVLPVMYFTGGFDGVSTGVQPSIGYSLIMGLLSIGVFLVINYRSLVASGQTVGKKVLEIKIVDLDGNLPTLRDHLLKRYGVYMLTAQVPMVGPVLNLINICFIFGAEKRCVHDLIAKTKVVKC